MLSVFSIFYIWISIAQASKILAVIPYPAKSHFIITNAVLKSLAQAGHEITVVTPFVQESLAENYTSVIDSTGPLYVSRVTVEFFSKLSVYGLYEKLTYLEYERCENVFNSKEIRDLLKLQKKKFDVLFVEVYYFPRCFNWIAKQLNVPIIGISTLRSWILTDWDIANPRDLFTSPLEVGKVTNLQSIRDRLQTVLDTLNVLYCYYSITRKLNDKFYQNYMKNLMSFDTYINTKPSLIFVNGHSSYYPRPLNPNMIQIGGINAIENQPLPAKIQEFLDDAKQGAILFTFGSVLKATAVSKHKIQAFRDAFAEIPQKIIWKYEEEIEGISSNVMLLKWLPQNDILAHKNTVAFISHCGQGAVQESIYNAVPVIACPLYIDQHVNARILINLKAAVHLDYNTITKESVLNALNSLLNNSSYHEKIQELSYSFKDRPMSPQQSVVYWTEYVIRHKKAFLLKSPATDLNWFQYFYLDLICLITLSLLMILLSFYFIVKLGYYFLLFRLNIIIKNKQAKED